MVGSRLAKLVASGLLDLGLIRVPSFPLVEIEAAMDAAAAYAQPRPHGF